MSSYRATPAAKRLAKERNIALAAAKVPDKGYFTAKDVLALCRVRVTPAARRLAESLGVDLSAMSVQGRRIYKRDVQAFRQQEADKKNAAIRKVSAMKRVTAQRMVKSHTEIPPVTLHTNADVSGLCRARKAYNSGVPAGEKISLNDYIVFASAKALRETPDAMLSYSDQGFYAHTEINIGVAVALDSGLVVPVLRQADQFDLPALSAALKQLIQRARDGKLTVDDYNGSTFTISNLGMYGITAFTPIINQPNSMILGACAIEQVLSMDQQGALFYRDQMGLSLTFDHRVHDGAQAAAFLQKIAANLRAFGT